MGHVVFAAPGIDAFGLHDRLGEALRQRCHATSTLCLDAGEHAFWRSQGTDAVLLREPSPATAIDAALPLEELLTDQASGRERTRHWLLRCAPAIERWLERAAPDLLWLHARRGPAQRLLHFLARRHAVRVLWTGPGLLPHTMQLDERGLDGDAAACQRPALDYRVVTAEPDLLHACLAHALADVDPFALPDRPIVNLPWRERLAAAGQVFVDRGLRAAWQSLGTWSRATRPRSAPAPGAPRAEPKHAPYVLVLLQADDDSQRRLDGDRIAAGELVARTRGAAAALDPQLAVVVVAAPGARVPHLHDLVRADARATAELASVATAIVTDNHPAAAIGLLAGTPVVHLGRALYGLPGVTWRCRRDELANTLAKALRRDHPILRQRFLTWLFGHGHVWCSPTRPDHNGVLGLVQSIEARLSVPADQAPLRYRSGPAWPLCSNGRSH
ncbi:MAG: hypothetical protein JNL12_02710 [Planctomycetes bacterium]|nr:hypothetical protein [Planctomycetota bacterium]